MVINPNIPPFQLSANLKVTLMVEKLNNDQFVVSIAEFPHFQVKAPTREEAISQLKASFREKFSQMETITWTTPFNLPSPSWMEFVGILEDDADFQDIMTKLQAERNSDDDSEVDPSYYL